MLVGRPLLHISNVGVGDPEQRRRRAGQAAHTVRGGELLRLLPPPPSPPRTTDAATAMREAGTPGGGGAVVVPIRGYHRLMVKTMTSSLRVPHMVYSDEVNVDALTAVRNSLRPLYAARDAGGGGDRRTGGKLMYMPFFVKAASLALTAFPVLNSTIDVGEMTLTYHAALRRRRIGRGRADPHHGHIVGRRSPRRGR